MLWGSPIELSNQAQLKNRIKESLLKNRRILSAYNLTERLRNDFDCFCKNA